MEQEPKFRGAGGTQGGLGEFLAGLAMAVAGAYLLTNQVSVTTGFWRWGGYNTFGLTLAGAVVILAGIIVNLDI